MHQMFSLFHRPDPQPKKMDHPGTHISSDLKNMIVVTMPEVSLQVDVRQFLHVHRFDFKAVYL